MKILTIIKVLILAITSNIHSQWSIQQYWPYYIDAFYFSGTSTGYMVTDNSVIRKTTNGGLNWENQDPNSTLYFMDIFFSNTNSGWAVGNSGVIRATTNGGQSWFSQSSGTPNDLQSVFFVNSTVSVTVL